MIHPENINQIAKAYNSLTLRMQATDAFETALSGVYPALFYENQVKELFARQGKNRISMSGNSLEVDTAEAVRTTEVDDALKLLLDSYIKNSGCINVDNKDKTITCLGAMLIMKKEYSLADRLDFPSYVVKSLHKVHEFYRGAGELMNQYMEWLRKDGLEDMIERIRKCNSSIDFWGAPSTTHHARFQQVFGSAVPDTVPAGTLARDYFGPQYSYYKELRNEYQRRTIGQPKLEEILPLFDLTKEEYDNGCVILTNQIRNISSQDEFATLLKNLIYIE